MTYQITPLSRADFAPLFAMDDAALAARGAIRKTALASQGYPCRVSLADAEAGETLILLNHISHDVATPYRSSYAIYVREGADESPALIDTTPAVFEGRPIGLRGFTSAGMLADARLALPGHADAKIRELFENAAIAYIHAHNAAHGCFSAKVERHD